MHHCTNFLLSHVILWYSCICRTQYFWWHFSGKKKYQVQDRIPKYFLQDFNFRKNSKFESIDLFAGGREISTTDRQSTYPYWQNVYQKLVQHQFYFYGKSCLHCKNSSILENIRVCIDHGKVSFLLGSIMEKLVFRSWKSENVSRKSENVSWKSETRSWKSES